MSTDEYLEGMRKWTDNIEYCGGTIAKSHRVIAIMVVSNENRHLLILARP
jgi:hypothetical protein